MPLNKFTGYRISPCLRNWLEERKIFRPSGICIDSLKKTSLKELCWWRMRLNIVSLKKSCVSIFLYFYPSVWILIILHLQESTIDNSVRKLSGWFTNKITSVDITFSVEHMAVEFARGRRHRQPFCWRSSQFFYSQHIPFLLDSSIYNPEMDIMVVVSNTFYLQGSDYQWFLLDPKRCY